MRLPVESPAERDRRPQEVGPEPDRDEPEPGSHVIVIDLD